MKTSESIKEIAGALLLAQKKMGVATKSAVNPYFKSSYADLGAVMEACKEALNSQDITVLQPVGTNDEWGVYVETVLLHSSGEFISDRLKVASKEKDNPQSQGSAISYARRYGLQSMVFIPAADDDGEQATNHKEKMDGKPRYCLTHRSYWGPGFAHCPKYQSGGTECLEGKQEALIDPADEF